MNFNLTTHGLLLMGLLLFQLPIQGQVVINTVQEKVSLNEFIEVLEDPEGKLSFEDLQDSTQSHAFQALSAYPLPLPHESHYWIRLKIQHQIPYAAEWMLHNPAMGMASLYFPDSTGTYQQYFSGRNMTGKKKVENNGDFIHFPLRMEAGKEYTLYLKLWEIDHQDIPVRLSLNDMLTWRSRSHIPLDRIILFFLGIFGIMMLYNLVLFVTLRFNAYLYYALYLLCVGNFVLFAVGPMTYPSGDPRWLVPIGHLAFGAINIFYYLFGKSFLNLKELLPTWDKILTWAIIIKSAFLLFAQIELYTIFNIPLALNIEFSLLLVDVLLNLVFFVALFKTKDRLAYYFIGGAGSVMVLGLSLAVIGHIFNLSYTFIIFLSSIVVEIIFFSLGLGYKIRKTEQEKLDAEREKRVAQETLNEKLSSINVVFKRFVPHEFIKSLGHTSVLDVTLGDGVQREVTVLFSDIRDYTTLSEKMTPKENFDFLNTYLGKMGPAIQKYNGFVNQYYGDGIMALFPNNPEDALHAAREMMVNLSDYNEVRKWEQKEAIRIGIGLHTGQLMMGLIGDADRMDAGVVADAVNTASRMEGLTKHYGVPILLSHQTLAGIKHPEEHLLRFLGKVQVKGKQQVVLVHESKAHVNGEEKAKFISINKTFEAGLDAYYRTDFDVAIDAFQAVLAQFPQDKAAQLYLNRSLTYRKGSIPADWTGVESM